MISLRIIKSIFPSEFPRSLSLSHSHSDFPFTAFIPSHPLLPQPPNLTAKPSPYYFTGEKRHWSWERWVGKRKQTGERKGSRRWREGKTEECSLFAFWCTAHHLLFFYFPHRISPPLLLFPLLSHLCFLLYPLPTSQSPPLPPPSLMILALPFFFLFPLCQQFSPQSHSCLSLP